MHVYVVMKNSDFTEGRGPMVLDTIFSNPVAATSYANAHEPYGAKVQVGKYSTSYAYGQFYEIHLVKVFDSYASKMKKLEEEKKREKALSKLTDEERSLLGLK